ncbi:DNA repair protein RAD5 [Candida albicans P78042]|nr:DNA repair protein RAD5 [Candida albicans P78042]
MKVIKKRFFKPKEETLPSDEVPDPQSSAEPLHSLFVPDESEEEETTTSPKTNFEKDIIAIVGDISPIIMKYLYAKYSQKRNGAKFAVTELLTNPPDVEKLQQDSIASQSAKRPHTIVSYQEPPNKKVNINPDSASSNNEPLMWQRLIGSLNIQAMATRPTMKPLKYQEKLKLKRITTKNSTMANSAIVRVYHNEREIGRIPEDWTRILSPLFDLNIAVFEASVLEETKSRLSTGDSFVIEIEVYLTNSSFAKNLDATENPIDLKKSNFDYSKESESEAALRLRQFAISNLFDRLAIKPLKVNDDTEDEEDISSQEINSGDVEHPVPEINLDQMKEFYQSNNQLKILEGLPETTTPPKENFALDLRSYQKHGLSWMLAREKELDVLEMLSNEDKLSSQSRKELENLGTMNPLWRKYKWPYATEATQDPTQNQTEKYFYANMYNGELSLEKPVIKSSLRGGILADEMGLGKTIATLALVNSVPYDNFPEPKSDRPYASQTTLIVVPMSLLFQWKSEFEKCNNNSRHVCRLHYGEDQETNLAWSLCNPDNSKIPIAMITTYGTVLNEFTRLSKRRNSKGELPKVGLYSVKFFRIILDEGHNIRNRNTKTAKSVYELQSSRKWILTGTPIVNRLDDLYSLTKFLELDPWNNFSYWKTFVTLPFEQKKISQTLDVVKSILEPIFLRRTKSQKKNGKPLVELPAKEVVIEQIKFNDDEEKLYQWFKDRAYASFAEGIKSGQLLRRYTQILTHILRLRQVCCHVDLIGGAHEMDDEIIEAEQDEDMRKFLTSIKVNQIRFANDTDVKEKMYNLYGKIKEENECSICTQVPIPYSEMVVTPCAHTFCLSCILEHLDFQKELKKEKLCPNCRSPISKYQLFRIRNQPTKGNEIRFHTQKDAPDYSFQLYLYDPNRSSSKIQALVRHLKALHSQSPNSKVIVFSQFSSYLDIIQSELKLASEEFIVFKFDGRLNMNDRTKLLESFNQPLEDGKVAILLLSLKAGGVGLNLTTASRAYMMDPWWSPSIEDQAIDRIHRIGQNETVKVVRFIMENSIETKMLKIQERKKQIGEAVAAEEEERRKRRIEEIQILFEE